MEALGFAGDPAARAGIAASSEEYFGMPPAVLVVVVVAFAIGLGGSLLFNRAYLRRVGKPWSATLHPRFMIDADFNKRELLILGATFALVFLWLSLSSFAIAWFKYR